MSGYGGSGPQGGKSLLSNEYVTYSYQKMLSDADLNTNGAFELQRITGHQEIVIHFLVPGPIIPSCTFYITGGSNTTQSNVLPMFPNTYQTYNQTINYIPAETPRGCIVETQPQPTGTTRINVFRVTETITGDGYSFIFAFSPFTKVNPTVTFPTGQPPFTGDMIAITSFFARLHPNMRSSGMPISSGAPEYFNREYPLTFPGGPNPLDDMQPHEFRRANGIQEIVVTIVSTGFMFSFPIDYGIIGEANGYIGFVSPLPKARIPVERGMTKIQNCIIEGIGESDPIALPSTFGVTTPTDPEGVRFYRFIFDHNPYTQKKPTIQLLGGSPFGASDVIINVVTKKFMSV